MEDELSELQQLAITDPDAHFRYLAMLVRSGKAREIEIQARLGKQDAILGYLQILDYQNTLDLEHLWVTPFFREATNFQDEYEFWPYDEPFMPPVRYTLGMTLQDIEKYYLSLYEFEAGTLIGAFINDVFDLELAENTSKRLRDELRSNLTSVPRHGQVSNVPQADLIAAYTGSLNKFYTLNASAILRMNYDGLHFQAPHEMYLYRQDQRQSIYYLNRIHRQELIAQIEPQQMRLDPSKWSPKREIKQLLPMILPESNRNVPYVLIVHTPSLRGFTLARGYNLLKEEITQEELISAMRYNAQIDSSWLPTAPHQMPEWAWNLPKEEFVAYWVSV